MNLNISIIKLDEETHLGWWIWICSNLKLATLYHETERGIISDFYINSQLFDDEAFLLEINHEMHKKVLLNFSSSVIYWLYKRWCMNCLSIIFSYFIDRISVIENFASFFLASTYFIMGKYV